MLIARMKPGLRASCFAGGEIANETNDEALAAAALLRHSSSQELLPPSQLPLPTARP